MALLHTLAMVMLATTFGLALAHALEFPGKRRLDEATYRAVQGIYFPGFTIGGLVGEVGGMIVLIALLMTTPVGSAAFPGTASALALLALVHAVYWAVTHPVNSAWLKGQALGGAGAMFFAMGSKREADWTRMRDAWETSHIIRAGLALAAFVALALAGR